MSKDLKLTSTETTLLTYRFLTGQANPHGCTKLEARLMLQEFFRLMRTRIGG